VLVTWFADELYRFATTEPMGQTMTRHYGDRSWQAALAVQGESARKRELLSIYQRRIGSLPRVHTRDFSISGKNETARYSPVFATHSDKGLQCFNPVAWRLDPYAGDHVSDARPLQAGLFDDTPAMTRLTDWLKAQAGTALPFARSPSGLTSSGSWRGISVPSWMLWRLQGWPCARPPLKARSPWPQNAIVRFTPTPTRTYAVTPSVSAPRSAFALPGSAALPGQLIPGESIELATTGLRGPPTPLFVEERDVGGQTRIADFAYPLGIYWAGARARFVSGDEPVDPVQIKAYLLRDQRAEKRLSREEPHGRRDRPKVVNPMKLGRILDGHSHPHVGRPRQGVCESAQSSGTLGQDLVGVLWGGDHDLEDLPHEGRWDPGVEEIAHRVDEHQAWFSPAAWDIERGGVQGDPEARARGAGVAIVLVLRGAHRLESLS
jgi:hypothetical protein